MSGIAVCKCKPRNVTVMHHKHHHSDFARGGHDYSTRSQVKCNKCGRPFRTGAAWVEAELRREGKPVYYCCYSERRDAHKGEGEG